jgi:hypothetical protein
LRPAASSTDRTCCCRSCSERLRGVAAARVILRSA